MFDQNDADLMRARTVGFGVPYVDVNLAVSCGTCKSPGGVPCFIRRAGSHTTRMDKARRTAFRKSHQLAMRHERTAYKLNCNSPLWTCQWTGHHCGGLGAHVLTDCTEAV